MSHYIQKLSENVERKHVRYQNRYGIAIAGDLYKAKGMDQKKRYPALIVGAPYGGVKEQGPCVYANELAQRGFVVLTFDPCYMGESGGEPRRVSSPDLFTENFSAGVDYLGLQEFVDREKIGVIGICGSGGFALSAAQVDTRIKAVATASMYDMSAISRAFFSSSEELFKAKDALSRQRWVDAENGYPEYIPTFPEEPLDAAPEGMADDRAHSKSFSEKVYKEAATPKEIYTVEDAEHIDLYDRTDRIPFDKLEEFFKDGMRC